jgi:hypothetical protein
MQMVRLSEHGTCACPMCRGLVAGFLSSHSQAKPGSLGRVSNWKCPKCAFANAFQCVKCDAFNELRVLATVKKQSAILDDITHKATVTLMTQLLDVRDLRDEYVALSKIVTASGGVVAKPAVVKKPVVVAEQQATESKNIDLGDIGNGNSAVDDVDRMYKEFMNQVLLSMHIEEMSLESVCSVCKVEECSTMLVPCGCKAVCTPCSKKMNYTAKKSKTAARCPRCQKHVSKYVSVYTI